MYVRRRRALAQRGSGMRMQPLWRTAHQVPERQAATATAECAVWHMLLLVHSGLNQCICYDETLTMQ